jgi:hypothetical protein
MRWGRSDGGPRRFSRPVGCLLWLIALILMLIVLASLFGGFQKGTRANGASAATAALALYESGNSMNVLYGLAA